MADNASLAGTRAVVATAAAASASPGQQAFPLRVRRAWGVSTARYVSCLPAGGGMIDVALGSGVARWDLRTGGRKWFFQAHSDSVTCMLALPDGRRATCSYSGEVRVWSPDWRVLLGQCTVAGGCMHAAASPTGDEIVVCSERLGVEGERDFVTRVHVTAARCVAGDVVRPPPDLDYTFACYDPTGRLLVVAENRPPAAPAAGVPAPAMSSSQANASKFFYVTRVPQSSKPVDGSEETIVRSASQPATSHTHLHVAATTPDHRTLAVVMGRHAWLFDSQTLAVRWHAELPGSGVMKAVCLDGTGALYAPSDAGYVERWRGADSGGASASAPQRVGERLSLGAPHATYYLAVSEVEHLLYVCTESALVALDLAATPHAPVAPLLQLHDMVACGLDFDTDGTRLVTGDLAGNVLVWRVHQPSSTTASPSSASAFPDTDDAMPIRRGSVLASVRSAAWRPGTELLQLGGLDGSLHQWNLREDGGGGGEMPQLALTLEGGVTCMRWAPPVAASASSSTSSSSLLAAGTTQGILAFIEPTTAEPVLASGGGGGGGGMGLRVVRSVRAHEPGAASDQFGSLHKFAEVWSVAWEPVDGGRIATASEDQSIRVWRRDGTQERRLPAAHASAVTALDWSGGRVVSCGDDRVAHVYETEQWQRVASFRTDLAEFHTITYCALSKGARHLMFGTQNGFVFVWDLKSGRRLYGAKLHCGSIEGMRYNAAAHLLATCSADCSLAVFEVASDTGSDSKI